MDKTNFLILTITPPSIKEEPYCTACPLGPRHLDSPPLGGHPSSSCTSDLPSIPAQGLPPDALSREAGCRKEGPPQHSRLQDQGGHGEGWVHFPHSNVNPSPIPGPLPLPLAPSVHQGLLPALGLRSLDQLP